MSAAEPSTKSWLTPFASVKLTVSLLTLIATTVLVGAWCPQESQVGIQKVIDQFGEEWAFNFSKWGVTDIFHSPWFLSLIGLLTLNMIACSVQRVFPKVRLLKQPLPKLKHQQISKLPFNLQTMVACPAGSGLQALAKTLRASGYVVAAEDQILVAEWGKLGRMAPTITHIGLLTLLLGVTITSWTGFSGFQPVALGDSLSFGDSEHSKLWIGKLPHWKVKVNATWRENYPSGEAKQWYSQLEVIDPQGKPIKSQQIEVNEPLGYDGVDIYQSSWGLDRLEISFNGHPQILQLQPMGKLYAAFMPLDTNTILIFSVRDQGQPLRVFGKTPQWPAPRLLSEIAPGQSVTLGSVALTYKRAIPVTGLQYKCDPGLPVTYVAFAFIMVGVFLAAIPYRQVWAAAVPAGNVLLEPVFNVEDCIQERQLALVASGSSSPSEKAEPTMLPKPQVNGSAYSEERSSNNCILYVGGRSPKARTAFEKSLSTIVLGLSSKLEKGLDV